MKTYRLTIEVYASIEAKSLQEAQEIARKEISKHEYEKLYLNGLALDGSLSYEVTEED